MTKDIVREINPSHELSSVENIKICITSSKNSVITEMGGITCFTLQKK